MGNNKRRLRQEAFQNELTEAIAIMHANTAMYVLEYDELLFDGVLIPCLESDEELRVVL